MAGGYGDQTGSRVSRGPLRGDGLRPPVLTDSLLTPATRPGYDALSRCAELARALAWGQGGSCFGRGAGWSQARRGVSGNAPLCERSATNVARGGTFVTPRRTTRAPNATKVALRGTNVARAARASP